MEVAKENDQGIQIYVYEAERTLKKNESLDDNFFFVLTETLRKSTSSEKVQIYKGLKTDENVVILDWFSVFNILYLFP